MTRTATTPAERRRERTAYHEAGHAVAAVLSGLRFRYVTIEPHDDALGHIRWSPTLGRVLFRFSDESRTPPRPRDVLLLGEYLTACLAANDAVKRLTGRYDNRGASSDHEAVFEATARFCGSIAQEEAFAEWRRAVAQDLVNLRWPEIKRVATALLECGRLTEADVREAMSAGWR